MEPGNEDCCAFCPEVAELRKDRDSLKELLQEASDRLYLYSQDNHHAIVNGLVKERDDLRADYEELILLVAKLRDEAFQQKDLATVNRCVESGAVGCPKSALLWVFNEIALLAAQLEREKGERERLEVIVNTASSGLNFPTRQEMRIHIADLKAQLAAAQSSAKGEFKRGMARAAEISYTLWSKGKSQWDIRQAIYAEANQPAQGEGGEDVSA